MKPELEKIQNSKEGIGMFKQEQKKCVHLFESTILKINQKLEDGFKWEFINKYEADNSIFCKTSFSHFIHFEFVQGASNTASISRLNINVRRNITEREFSLGKVYDNMNVKPDYIYKMSLLDEKTVIWENIRTTKLYSSEQLIESYFEKISEFEMKSKRNAQNE